MRSNSEMKAAAKAQLGGKLFGDKWLMATIVCVIGGAMIGLLSKYTYVGELLLSGPIAVATMVVFLELKRTGETPNIGKFFGEMFNGNFARYFVVGLLSAVFCFLWALLFIIPGIVKGYAYAMCPYLVKRNPEMEAMDCLKQSEKIMMGHKMQLFKLDLSFLGWFIVGGLCLGVGAFWVEAWWNTARANFYDDLYAEYAEGLNA